MAELRRWTDKRRNPCTEESKASFKCMDDNNYNRNACMEYFHAYRRCKTAWNERKAERRRNGLPPNDPEPTVEQVKIEQTNDNPAN